MSIVRKIKNNFFLRSCGVFACNILCAFKGYRQFAKCGDNIIITPPFI